VEVRLFGGTTTAVTDDSGAFRLPVSARGSVIITLRKLGYTQIGIPLDLESGDSLHVATTLSRVLQSLDTVRIAGRADIVAPSRLVGFERRRLFSQGTFITPEQLERTASTSIGDVLRGIPSINVTDDRLGFLSVESTRGMRLDRSGRPIPCRVRVMVDGFVMPFEAPMPVVSPKQLHGIEVYSGPATMPRELIPYGQDAFCGLVAIWTK
jgi:outer membrane receptor for Fe3+-dicitrate